MARLSNITAAQVSECAEKAQDAARAASAIEDAIGKCRTDDVPEAYEAARRLMTSARDLISAAASLLLLKDMQEMKAKLKP